MQELSFIQYEKKEQIAYITINRPTVRNAMSPDSWEEFGLCLTDAEQDQDVRVLIITGAGEKAFISGADITELKTRTPMYQLYYPISLAQMRRIEDSGKPVIAAINGAAFGGGFETALACDIRIASRTAKFGLPEPNLGILPGAGGTQRLARMVGVGRAKEIILAGKILSAEEACREGLLMKVTEPEDLMEEAAEIAKTIMKKAPVSLNISKKLINHALDTDLSTGYLAEQLGFCTLLATEDKLEGTSAFLEKRPAEFKGK